MSTMKQRQVEAALDAVDADFRLSMIPGGCATLLGFVGDGVVAEEVAKCLADEVHRLRGTVAQLEVTIEAYVERLEEEGLL